MKKNFILGLIALISFVLLTGLMAFKNAETPTSDIIIRAKLAGGGSTWKKRSYIKIYKPNGTAEVEYPFTKEQSWEDDEEVLGQVMKVVNKYQQMGYEITSFTESVNGVAFFSYNFVLSKK